MRHATRTLTLLAALAAGSAGAQDLGAYRTLAQSLDAAAQARPASAERALTELDRAEAAYAQLAPTLQNKQLLGGLRDALDGARGALARTPAEVQAQVLLARGLMRRALYDQTLNQLAQTAGTPAAGGSAAQVKLLAREFGLTGAPAAALVGDAGAGHLERVAWRLQRAAAQKVGAALNVVRPERSPASYVNLARATGWFTVVQDAGAQNLKVAQFTAALGQLTAGDVPALTASLGTLRQGAAALSRSLSTPPASVGPAKAAGAAQSPAPRPSEAQTPAAQTPEAQTPGTQTPDAQTPEAASPGTVSTPAAPASGGVDAAYTALGRALTAVGHGDPEAARSELGRVPAALASAPAALRRAGGYDTLTQHLAAAQERRGLRPGDVQALIAELGGLERSVAGEGRSTVDTLSAGVARTFSGGLRAVVFLLLALLGLVPLYLLNLAFGGRNPYWRAITAALVLLLLPVFLEGVFGFLGWVGDLSGVTFLRAAPSLTLWQGVYGLPLRALFTALAIALASYGFRGLCVQFGLLGRQSAARSAPQPSLDWDEEPS
ncbi:hypothetical protein DEIPH_ctg052orf0071 [Deinococcus phoenicis]|uniref:Uncharacterized protein n=1 Tax=Deinococcus phoenicis TaxID=1476583 RepID=A0A016QMV6_9DEIO|nr:hypothetical protein [Deinococcus phoenicis]EYB67069.1 hypothetical protein DEIPH_ctg052orf0071 [Deinococcus phoenicis]